MSFFPPYLHREGESGRESERERERERMRDQGRQIGIEKEREVLAKLV